MSNATLEPPPLPEPDWSEAPSKVEAPVKNETMKPIVSEHSVAMDHTENHEKPLDAKVHNPVAPIVTRILPHGTPPLAKHETPVALPTVPHSEHGAVITHTTEPVKPQPFTPHSAEHSHHDEQLRQQTHHLEEALTKVKQDLKMVTDYMSRVEAYLPQVEALLKQPAVTNAPHQDLESHNLLMPEPIAQALVIKPQSTALKTMPEPHRIEPKLMTLDVKPTVTTEKMESNKPIESVVTHEPPEEPVSIKEIAPELAVKPTPQEPALSSIESKEQEEKRAALTAEISRLKQKIEQTTTYLKGLQNQGGRRQELINKIEKESKLTLVQVEKMLTHDSEESHLEEEYKLLLLELAPYREKLKVLQQKQNEFGNLSVFQFGEWKRLKAEIEALQGELAPFRTQVDRARSIYNRIKDLPRWREMFTELQKLGDLAYLNEAKPAIVNDITSMEDQLKQHETELAALGKKQDVVAVKA